MNNSIEQSPRGIYAFAWGPEILRRLWNPEVRYRTRKSPLNCILSQMNPLQIVFLCFSVTRFNVSLLRCTYLYLQLFSFEFRLIPSIYSVKILVFGIVHD